MTAPDPVEHWDWRRDFGVQPDRRTTEDDSVWTVYVAEWADLGELMSYVAADWKAGITTITPVELTPADIAIANLRHREERRRHRHRRLWRLARTALLLALLGAATVGAIYAWRHQ